MRSTRGQIGRLVQLDQRRHSQLDDRIVKLPERCVVQTFGDQQHGVGPGRAGFDHLIRVDDEILPQHGQIDRRADLPQVIEAALEIRLVGQHADARGPVLLVDPRDGHGIEVGADDALAGAGLLDFGDQPNGRTCRECGEESRAAAGHRPAAGATSASGLSLFALATSSRFVATILSRIVGMGR